MKRAAPPSREPKQDPVDAEVAPSRTLSAGFLAMIPMIAAYEFVVATQPNVQRNAGERVFSLLLTPAGARLDVVRWILLGAFTLAALATLRLRGVDIARTLARIVLEGAACAVVLGPLLVLAARAAERWVGAIDVSWDPTDAPPTLAEVSLVFGAGAWEELLCRVGLYSFLYLLAMRFGVAVGFGLGLARGMAEIAGLVLSSLAFASLHFDPFTHWVGATSRAFEPDAFAWLCFGGLALGVVYRWRGPGVAAWAHALFNVAIWIGIDPDVIW